MYLPEIKVLYNRLKGSASSRGIEFTLSLMDMYELSYPITCPILDIPLHFHRGRAKDDSYSIDRKDSSIGYTIDNIHVISNKANRIKNNATNDELSRISSYFEK